MKKQNKVKGFTLMELMVVIAIVAVLSAALVPSATYFIRRSKLKTANSEAKIVYNAALTVAQEYEAKNVSITSTDASGGNPAYNSGDKIELSNIREGTNDIQKDFIAQVNRKVLTDESDKTVWAVRFTNSSKFPSLAAAVYSTTPTDRYVGGYPHPTPATNEAGFSGYKALDESSISGILEYAANGGGNAK